MWVHFVIGNMLKKILNFLLSLLHYFANFRVFDKWTVYVMSLFLLCFAVKTKPCMTLHCRGHNKLQLIFYSEKQNKDYKYRIPISLWQREFNVKMVKLRISFTYELILQKANAMWDKENVQIAFKKKIFALLIFRGPLIVNLHYKSFKPIKIINWYHLT